MIPYIAALSTTILACIGSAVATRFTLSDVYDASNFADKFNFVTESDFNAGFVVYQAKDQAFSQGLFSIRNNQVYVGVDHTTVLQGPGFPGRNSLRLESKASYTHGLIVARFTHLPSNRCGTWPAFWTVGDNWPSGGEIDLYEGWNDNIHNQPAFHVGSSSHLGTCRLDGAGQTSPVLSSNCDNTYNDPPRQFPGQGCTAAENKGPWASNTGGTYAIEWTSQYIKLFNFARGSEPANLASANPDTALWGTPSIFLKNSLCDIDGHFRAQRLVLDITFCGNPAGTDAFWKRSCAAKTGRDLCADYVAKSPGDFSESYFQIQDIRYFAPQRTFSMEHDKRAGGNGSPTRLLVGTRLESDNGTGVIAPQPAGTTGSAVSWQSSASNTGKPEPVPHPTNVHHNGSHRNSVSTTILICILAAIVLVIS